MIVGCYHINNQEEVEEMADPNKQNAEANESEQRTMPDEEIDKTLAESFPASDPPSWTLGIDPHPQTKEDADG